VLRTSAVPPPTMGAECKVDKALGRPRFLGSRHLNGVLAKSLENLKRARNAGLAQW
jgi:hypothetical protein